MSENNEGGFAIAALGEPGGISGSGRTPAAIATIRAGTQILILVRPEPTFYWFGFGITPFNVPRRDQTLQDQPVRVFVAAAWSVLSLVVLAVAMQDETPMVSSPPALPPGVDLESIATPRPFPDWGPSPDEDYHDQNERFPIPPRRYSRLGRMLILAAAAPRALSMSGGLWQFQR